MDVSCMVGLLEKKGCGMKIKRCRLAHDNACCLLWERLWECRGAPAALVRRDCHGGLCTLYEHGV